MRRSLVLSALAAAASLAALLASSPPSARADETAPPIPKLEKHPWADAKPGEWLRFKDVRRGETRFLVSRVIATKPEESKVFFEIRTTSEDGKQVLALEQPGRWITVPKLEPIEGQEFKKDEMVMFEIGDKKVPARHFKIVEPVNPSSPVPVRTREVWFSNDVLGSGKLQEWSDNPSFVLTALEWGTMPAEELAKVREEYRLEPLPAAEGGKPADAPKEPAPGEKPAGGGGGSSCGGGGGGTSCGGK